MTYFSRRRGRELWGQGRGGGGGTGGGSSSCKWIKRFDIYRQKFDKRSCVIIRN